MSDDAFFELDDNEIFISYSGLIVPRFCQPKIEQIGGLFCFEQLTEPFWLCSPWTGPAKIWTNKWAEQLSVERIGGRASVNRVFESSKG